MQRRKFLAIIGGVLAWPWSARAQSQPQVLQQVPQQVPPQDQPAQDPPPDQPADDEVGQVSTLTGTATVTRPNVAAAALKASDPIYRSDVILTGANAALAITFDDETTITLTANARVTISEFVYEEGGGANQALFNVARGTLAFVASKVAKTGDMKISTPSATLAIRGTTGIVDVPFNAASGGGEARIKLYPDADGRTGQIEVFNRQGGRLGALTQGASAFAIRGGPGGRFAAVPFPIPPQEIARDRGVVQRLFAAHTIGRQMTIQRRQQRGPNRARPNNTRPNNRPVNPRQPGGVRQPGVAPQRPNRGPVPPQRGNQPPPRRGVRERLRDPFNRGDDRLR